MLNNIKRRTGGGEGDILLSSKVLISEKNYENDIYILLTSTTRNLIIPIFKLLLKKYGLG